MSERTTEPIRRILLATDFSPPANAAVEYAERLAACTGASLLVLTIRQRLGSDPTSDESDDQMQRMFEEMCARVPGVPVEQLVLGGSPGEVICWVAQEKACDQIVMGTHGRTGILNLLMGSTAEYVVRHARCPVLTVPSRSNTEEPLKEPNFGNAMPRIQAL
ncbi:MAG: universal stress protein [Planctomycetales bacterium]|nr:universal stress protein [Planctomycetales bacterium]